MTLVEKRKHELSPIEWSLAIIFCLMTLSPYHQGHLGSTMGLVWVELEVVWGRLHLSPSFLLSPPTATNEPVVTREKSAVASRRDVLVETAF